MKAQFFFVCLLLSSATSWAQAPTNGLVAYYPFTAPNATDASGNNRDGTFSGSVSPATDRLGNANQAYKFDGTGSITITNWQILTGNAARTVSVWFKSDIPTESQMMLFWGSVATNAGNALGIGLFSPAPSPIDLGFYAITTNGLSVTNQLQYFDSRWHLLTFTHDGGTMRLYIDGALQKTATNVTLNTSSSNLVIGSYIPNSTFYRGTLDEVRIYNRALTDREIQQMYTAEAPPPPSAEFAKIGSTRFIHTIGIGNTSVGNMAGNAITSGAGTQNTFMGFQTGRDNTAGSYNTFMGYQAGYLTTTGGNNVFLGANANPVGTSATTIQNSVALGANAKVAISNAIVFGDTTNTNIKVGIGTAAPRYPLDVKGSINIRRGASGPGKLMFASRSSVHADEQDYLVFTGGRKGESGLQLANLNSNSPVIGTANQFLSLDTNGCIGLYRPTLSATQVKLQTANVTDWADHVFSKAYAQMTLNELEQYIKENQHLPYLPSAQTMTQQGATVENLIKGLVQTQEEQTKYILELQKKNAQTLKENGEIRALLKKLLKKSK